MRWVWLIAVIWGYGVELRAEEAGVQEGNLCTNGSFEQVDRRGFPADWGAVGRTVGVSSEAHSGRVAIRLLRKPETPSQVETGLNRTKLIDRVQGGMEFWYKALSADSAQLRIVVIPIGEDGMERTGSARAEYLVPTSHIGDGQWHRARIRYDYRDNPKVKRVHFAARITGKAGQLLLDDIAYLEQTGPIVQFRRLRWEEDAERAGEKLLLSARLENVGDSPAKQIQVMLHTPEGLKVFAQSGPASEGTLPNPPKKQSDSPKDAKVLPEEKAAKTLLGEKQPGFSLSDDASLIMIPRLDPGETVWIRWTVEGVRSKPGVLDIRAIAEGLESADRLAFAPQMVLRSFGPERPAAIAGRPIRVECVVENPGRAMLLGVEAEVRLSSEVKTLAFPPIRPGQWTTQAVEFIPDKPVDSVPLRLLLRASGQEPIEAASDLVVLADQKEPPPTGRLHAAVTDHGAVLENKHLRLIFPKAEGGFGPAELQVRKPTDSPSKANQAASWIPAAWLVPFSRIVWQTDSDQMQTETVFCQTVSSAEEGQTARLVFSWKKTDAQGGQWELQATFSLAAEDRLLQVQYRLQCDQPRNLRHFQGPMLSVLQRREAIFPGLEWLVGEEVSSSSLDIAEDHPHRVRRVVHPQMITIPAVGIDTSQGVVGLLWDNRPRPDRPAVIFESPDRQHHRRTHLVGLFLPSVPEYIQPNELLARKPYLLKPGQPLQIQCQIYADGSGVDALSVVERWMDRYGVPDPTPLPHGSYPHEIAFSMQAYLQSLWDSQTQQWWTTKGGGRMSKQGRPASFVADLLLGELLSPDRALAAACRARAEEVVRLIGGPVRLDAQRFPGRFDLAVANPNHAGHLLAHQHEDGTWRFDADQEPKEGPFVGMDYHQLGPDEALEVGTCARNAYQVLRYARIAGDMEVYEQMVPTLEVMAKFRVPRAAQVWEVPVHTPDVLAAADAVDAFLEAYWISGQQRWLEAAVLWARRGLPFVYLWEDPEKPFLLGASIPVFGATWYQGSWFGRPVQWNGLRYAVALLKLARHDQTHPWQKLATLIIHSAIHQQAMEGEDVALWPDNISAIDSQRCPWVFSPRQILQCIEELLDRSEEPRTVIVGQGDRRLHLTTPGQIREAAWDQKELRFTVAYPPGEQGVVLISPVTRPEEVGVDGQPTPERKELEQSDEPGWRYDAGYAYLSVRIPRSGPVKVEIRPAEMRKVSRVARLARRIAFEFTESTEGWLSLHQVEDLQAAEGFLQGQMMGPDPYLGRYLLQVPGRSAPVLQLRMRTSAGRTAQLFWATQSSPHFDEQKSIRFAVQSDGQFHEYRLEVGKHPAWSEEVITALRLDPADQPGRFALDYLRSMEE